MTVRRNSSIPAGRRFDEKTLLMGPLDATDTEAAREGLYVPVLREGTEAKGRALAERPFNPIDGRHARQSDEEPEEFHGLLSMSGLV